MKLLTRKSLVVGVHMSAAGHLVAAGTAHARRGTATVHMRALRPVRRGRSYAVTVVAGPSPTAAVTSTSRIIVR